MHSHLRLLFSCFLLLDRYWIIWQCCTQNCIENFNKLYAELKWMLSIIKDELELTGLTKQLVHIAQKVFGVFEEAAENDATKTGVLDGTVRIESKFFAETSNKNRIDKETRW